METSDSQINAVAEVSDFCQLLRNQEKARLCLKAYEGCLGHPIWKRRKRLIADTASISLKTALYRYNFLPSSRVILMVIIAHSYSQFYTTKWMPRPWTKDDLHFLSEEDDFTKTWQLYPHRPHLSTSFESEIPLKQYPPIAHRHPKILALGIMLLEVELGLDLQAKWKPKYSKRNGTPTINIDYLTAMDLLTEDTLWSDQDTMAPVKEVIESCLQLELEGNYTVSDELKFMHEKVIAPLEHLWHDTRAGSLSELDVARIQPMQPKLAPSPIASSNLVYGVTNRPLSPVYVQVPQATTTRV